MTDLDQVVDLGAGADPRLSHRGAVDGAAATHLHTVFQHHLSRLGHLAPPLGRGNETEPLGADHGIGMHHAAPPDPAAGMEHGIGVQFTAVGDDDIVVNHHPGMHDAVRTDPAGGTDADPWSDGRAGSHLSPVVDHGRGVNLRQGATTGMQPLQCLGEGQPGIGEDGEGDTALGGQIDQVLLVRQQHSPGMAVGQCRRQGVALLQKTELIRSCRLKRCGAAQLRIRRCRAVPQTGLALLQSRDQSAEAHG